MSFIKIHFIYFKFINLQYNSDNVISKKDHKQIQKYEGKVLKRLLNLSYRTKNTEFLRAINIEKTKVKLDLEKCRLLVTLTKNRMTYGLMNEIMKDTKSLNRNNGKWSSFISEVASP
jgi:hypothetical protein